MLNRENRHYGELPKNLGSFSVDMPEMIFHQYLPLKMNDQGTMFDNTEKRLYPYGELIRSSCMDFIREFGIKEYNKSYVYLTVKNMYMDGRSFNREGWHSDGFMSDDINYIWSDACPTQFAIGKFILSQDNVTSLQQMQAQANFCDFFNQQLNKDLIRLDEYNIHRVSEEPYVGMRNFFKLSISKNKYNLKGNAINHLIDYKWDYYDRNTVRNDPSKM